MTRVAVVGSPMVVIISEITRDYGAWNMVFYSFIVIVIMRIYRDGITSLFLNLFKRISARWPRKQTQTPSYEN